MHYYNALRSENYASVTINHSTIKRSVISCALECKGSIEGIQAHLENIFDLHISEGSI